MCDCILWLSRTMSHHLLAGNLEIKILVLLTRDGMAFSLVTCSYQMSQFSQVIDSLNLIQLTIKARVFILNWQNSSMSSESPRRIPTHILISQVWGGSRFGISSNLLEKAMAPHSSTLAWKIPWMEIGGAWQAAVHGVAKSWTRLSNFTFTFHFHVLEKEMATHSSVLAWRIPGTGEPGGLPSMGSHRVGHD